MSLSICYPTYNRGELAYNRVMELLPFLSDDVELVMSNNGSEKGKEFYDMIGKIDNPHLHYNRFSENKGAAANFITVLKMAETDFAMLISDEDSVVTENLPYYTKLLNDRKDLAFIKASGTKMYKYDETCEGSYGVQALQLFYLCGNYISGAIYNRKFLTNQIIDTLQKAYTEKNGAWDAYLHMTFDTVLLLAGNAMLCSVTLISEGTPIKSEPDGKLSKTEICISGLSYTSLNNRISQFDGFLDQIRDLTDDLVCQCLMSQCLICKYAMLINNLRGEYEKAGKVFGIVGIETAYYMEDRVYSVLPDMLNVPEYKKIVDEQLVMAARDLTA